MTRRLSIPAIAALTFLIGCAEPPLASIPDIQPSLSMGGAYSPGEQQTVLEAPGTTWAIYPQGVGQNLAQTFTPTENQWLGYLNLWVVCANAVYLNIKIRKGLGGAILHENRHLIGGSSPFAVVFQVFDPAIMPHGIKLKKDSTYAFELAAVPTPGFPETTCGIARGPGVSSYAGGVLYAREPGFSPNWAPISRTSGPGDEDLPFITLVR